MSTQRTWIEIDHHALKHNITTIKHILQSSQQLAAVIKGNAYGHGLVAIARLLDHEQDVALLCTAGLHEAVLVRQSGIKKSLFAMSYVDDDPVRALTYDIDLAITNEEMLQHLEMIAKRNHQQFSVHVKIDTGLSRLGIPMDRALQVIKKINQSPYFVVKGIFTHLADNKQENPTYTYYQLSQFKSIADQVQKFLTSCTTHAQASASLLYENVHYDFDMMRIGTNIYGLYKSTQQEMAFKQHDLALKPVMTWKSRLIEIKRLPAGTAVSYGCMYTTSRDTSVGIIPVGYWDGYPSLAPGTGVVLVNDIPAPILGVVTMNMIIIDITHIADANVGSTVTLIGDHPEVTAAALAARVGSINIAVLCRINASIPRLVVEEEKVRSLPHTLAAQP